MYWVGKTSDRVGRGKSTPPLCETRWIVPVKPYEAPRGSMEKLENAILMAIGVVSIVFTFAILVMASL